MVIGCSVVIEAVDSTTFDGVSVGGSTVVGSPTVGSGWGSTAGVTEGSESDCTTVWPGEGCDNTVSLGVGSDAVGSVVVGLLFSK